MVVNRLRCPAERRGVQQSEIGQQMRRGKLGMVSRVRLAPNSFITCYLLFAAASSVGPGNAFHEVLVSTADTRSSSFCWYWRVPAGALWPAVFSYGHIAGCTSTKCPDPQQCPERTSAADKRRPCCSANKRPPDTTFARSFSISTK